jgi:5,10-methylenetetrahydrofolate reductase
MHISQKLAQAREEGKPTFSFEFFPPKTAQVTIPSYPWHEERDADFI